MRDRELYSKILGIEAPWQVTDVELKLAEGEVTVFVKYDSRAPLHCPCCGKSLGQYDTRRREWRHLDTCQYKTILVAEVPRVQCPEHKVKQLEVPWSEPNSRFTALFECLVIDWLREAPTSVVAERLNLSWDQANGIMERAVRRGLARRKLEAPKRIGVDETSFKKRYKFVTVVADLDTSQVLYVADDRKQESLDGYFKQLSEEHRAGIEVVAMDMWPAYIRSVRECLPDGDKKIAFDRFHVAQHIGDAMDKVRREEHRELKSVGDDRLTRTKYLWLQHPDKIDEERWKGEFKTLRQSALRTARAYALKEEAAAIWSYCTYRWARWAWKRWLSWACRCRLQPMVKVARMVRRRLDGILNAIVHGVTNAACESLNAKIQDVKRRARGFRNPERFRNAIYFHLGGLQLYPATHTES